MKLFKVVVWRRKIEIFSPIEAIFELHSGAMELKKAENRAEKIILQT